jgi:excisionase family DNA binding protein
LATARRETVQNTDSMLVGLPEAARRMGLGISTIKLLVQRKELRSLTVGKRRLIPVAAIDEFVARRLAAVAE